MTLPFGPLTQSSHEPGVWDARQTPTIQILIRVNHRAALAEIQIGNAVSGLLRAVNDCDNLVKQGVGTIEISVNELADSGDSGEIEST